MIEFGGFGFGGGGAPVSAAGNPGEIQWNDGGSFGASSNLFWDNVNERLGVGTNTPAARLELRDSATSTNLTSGYIVNQINNSGSSGLFMIKSGLGFAQRIDVQGNASGLFIQNTSGSTSKGAAITINTFNGSPNNAIAITNGNIQFVASTQFRQQSNINGVTRFVQRSTTNLTAFEFVDSAGASIAKFSGDGLSGFGTTTPQARVDIRAQGALSTDLVFRVRNQSDTTNFFQVNGDGSVGMMLTASSDTAFINSTGAGLSSGKNVFINSAATGGGNKTWNVCINGTITSGGGGQTGVVQINTDCPSPTTISLGKNAASSGSIYAGNGRITFGNNVSIGTGFCAIGKDINWFGGGTSNGLFVFGNNPGTLINGYSDAFAFGINRVDLVIGGGRGNLGVGGYNPTGRAETNTFFQSNGTAPITSVVNAFQLYSADIVAGNAAPHFRTEAGQVIKLYQSPASSSIKDIVENTGFSGTNEMVYAKEQVVPVGDLSIDFTEPKIYGKSTVPNTANIINDLTNAKIGVIQKIYHNNGVAPTFPAGWVLLSGAYVTGVLNIITCEFAEGTRVEYKIIQG